MLCRAYKFLKKPTTVFSYQKLHEFEKDLVPMRRI